MQCCRLKSSITTLYTSVVICNGVYLTKVHTKVVRCNNAKKNSIAIVQFNVVMCNNAYRKSPKVHTKAVKQKLVIAIVNTKVNCIIVSIYGNSATKMS